MLNSSTDLSLVPCFDLFWPRLAPPPPPPPLLSAWFPTTWSSRWEDEWVCWWRVARQTQKNKCVKKNIVTESLRWRVGEEHVISTAEWMCHILPPPAAPPLTWTPPPPRDFCVVVTASEPSVSRSRPDSGDVLQSSCLETARATNGLIFTKVHRNKASYYC